MLPSRPLVRWLTVALVLGAVVAVVLAVHGYREARRDPVVRHARIALGDWPQGAPPIRVALLSDIHLGTWAMDGARLSRLVSIVNAQRPDLILIAGDFVAGQQPGTAALVGAPMVAPLSRLRAPLGTIAVLGNHDHWMGAAAVRGQLEQAGIRVLANQAVAAGPLAIGGVDDSTTDHADYRAVAAAIARVPGARLYLSHSPDIGPHLPRDSMVFAGHTHCGQIVLPLIGPLPDIKHVGRNMRCGLLYLWGRHVLISGGLGTSIVPVRIGAPPDFWMVTLGPPDRAARP